ncbi:hypothetical protein GCM10022252_04090 [Streptosporangium oxazolinicum]|uniref:Uncharacterized protein n=1 Tax=Streptosporangium oxazolinicum TaxID=909287 RepID=A0ABP8AAD0_9ACTN
MPKKKGINLPRRSLIHGPEDAHALADAAVTALIPDAYGSEVLFEIVRGLLNDLNIDYQPNEELRAYGATLAEAMIREWREREENGLSPLEKFPNISTSAQVAGLGKTSYARICIIRDVLAVLIEASLPLRVAQQVIPDDPVVRHLLEECAQYGIIDYCFYWANMASRGAPEKAWKVMAPTLITLIGLYGYGEDEEKFARFRSAITKLDPVLDELPGMIERIQARLAGS